MLQPTAFQFITVTMFAYCRCLIDGRADVVNGVSNDVAVGSNDALSAEMAVEREEVLFDETLTKLFLDEPPDQADSGKDSANALPERMQLFQYDPVHIGHVHHVADETGRIMELVTAALDPPIFEIRNFLSSEECDQVIKLAIESGLQPSNVVKELLPSFSEGNEDEIRVIFEELDADGDSLLGPAELADGLMDIAQGLLSEDDVKELMAELELDPNHDDHLDFEEFRLTWTPDMERSVNQWVKKKQDSNDASFQFSYTRVSDQAWLDQSWYEDDTLIQLQERVVKLMQLPRDIVVSSESLQVVRYEAGGHYHAHFDSSELDDKLLCSHTEEVTASDDVKDQDAYLDAEEQHEDSEFDSSTFRLCRFATVLFYLNDVEEGGETAFPVADNETFSYEAFNELPYDLYDLSYHCYDGNLVVKPEKGKAILWYNHMVNKSTGWIGDSYNTSLHGGCDVRKGQKWIANNWINIDDAYSRQMEYHEFYHRELAISRRERERGWQENENDSLNDETIDFQATRDYHREIKENDAFDGKAKDEL